MARSTGRLTEFRGVSLFQHSKPRASGVCITGFAAAAVAGALTLSQVRAQPSGPPKVIEAQEFRLVDRDGKPRGRFAVGEDNVSSIAILDRDGNIRASLRVRSDGSTSISIHDADGRNRAAIDVLADGTSQLALSGKSGKSAAAIIVPAEKDPLAVMSDTTGKTTWAAP